MVEISTIKKVVSILYEYTLEPWTRDFYAKLSSFIIKKVAGLVFYITILTLHESKLFLTTRPPIIFKFYLKTKENSLRISPLYLDFNQALSYFDPASFLLSQNPLGHN